MVNRIRSHTRQIYRYRSKHIGMFDIFIVYFIKYINAGIMLDGQIKITERQYRLVVIISVIHDTNRSESADRLFQ